MRHTWQRRSTRWASESTKLGEWFDQRFQPDRPAVRAGRIQLSRAVAPAGRAGRPAVRAADQRFDEVDMRFEEVKGAAQSPDSGSPDSTMHLVLERMDEFLKRDVGNSVATRASDTRIDAHEIADQPRSSVASGQPARTDARANLSRANLCQFSPSLFSRSWVSSPLACGSTRSARSPRPRRTALSMPKRGPGFEPIRSGASSRPIRNTDSGAE